jgi:hypothetical protein
MSWAGVPTAIPRAFGCMRQIFFRYSRACTCAERVIWHTSHVTHHTSYIIHHTSYIIHYTSHITHHTSHATRHACLQIRVQAPPHPLEQLGNPRRMDHGLRWWMLQVHGPSLTNCQLDASADSVCAANRRGLSTRSSACGAGDRCCIMRHAPPARAAAHCVDRARPSCRCRKRTSGAARLAAGCRRRHALVSPSGDAKQAQHRSACGPAATS